MTSGGAGARYLGVGGSVQYREDAVSVSLRMISVATGEILIEVLSQKPFLVTEDLTMYFVSMS